MKSFLHAPRARQRGVVLVVVLLLLLVMTILALASMRGTLMEERMAANLVDRSYSFQATEAALREAEIFVAQNKPTPGAGCTAGVCGIPNPDNPPVWLDAAVWAAAPEATYNVGSVTAKPKYIIELLANDNIPGSGSCTTSGDVSESADTCGELESRYRITARSQAAGRAEVLLQSIYAVP
jgi:type IV pilus assembly protein PilX